MSRWDPVTYSPATRRAMTKLEQQITLIEEYLAGFSPNRERRLSEYGKLVGLGIALSSIAEQHRQWSDHARYQATQGHYARLLSRLEIEEAQRA